MYEAELRPDVAWDGTSFLDAWIGAVDNLGAIGIGAIPLTGQASRLPTYHQPNAEAYGLAIGSNTTGYALWLDDWHVAELDLATSLAAGPLRVASSPEEQDSHGEVSIASDGSHYFGVYSYWDAGSGHVAGTLVDGSGGASTTIPIATTQTPDGSPASNSVAWNGSTYAVSWVAYCGTTDGGFSSLFDANAAFFDATGKLVAGPLSVTGGCGGVAEATVACGAGSCVYAWTTPDGAIVTRAFSASGAPSGPPTSLAGPSAFGAFRLAWDGGEYVLAAASTQVGPDDLVATWLDASGAQTGGGFTTVASGALANGVGLRIASDRAGTAAVTYMRFQDRRATTYLLTAPPSPPDAGPDAGPEAGPPDGSDAGPPGGGPSDAGPFDAGPPDATLPDAGAQPVGLDASADAASTGAGDSGATSGCACTAAGGPPLQSSAAGLFAVALLAFALRRSRARVAYGRR
jgi:MYXO-CTERM domain-containing protein